MDCLSYFYYIMYERYKIFYKHSVFRSEALNSATNYAYFRAHLRKLHRRYLLFFFPTDNLFLVLFQTFSIFEINYSLQNA